MMRPHIVAAVRKDALIIKRAFGDSLKRDRSPT